MKRLLLFILAGLPVAAQAQVSINVSTTADNRVISPYIYGLNPYQYDNNLTGLNVQAAGINVSSLRFGGDAVSTYNWEKNVDISYDGSCGSDYTTNSNNDFLAYVSGQASGLSNPAGAILKFYSDAVGIGAYPLVQLTGMQYAANDANGCLGAACGQGVSSGRMVHTIIQKPGALLLSPDLTDTSVYTDEELNYLRAQPIAPAGVHGYCLENEPGIWNSTHPCAHAQRATCNEVLTKNITLAKRIRTLDAGADIFGPGMYGFTEYAQLNYDATVIYPADWNTYNLSDTTYNAATYNQMTWICSYLRQMRNAGNTYGQRLLDVLDLHYYNSGSDLTQDSRSFWDSSYVENSYITQDIINGASLKLVHCLNRAIADWYPGTKLGFTEWGLLDNTDAASGIYTADMLGALGRNGVYLANYFGVLQGFNAGAFMLYRNYDGNNSGFGSTSLQASSADNSKVTAYAASNAAGDSLHVILINRTASAQTASVHLSASGSYTSAQAWGMNGSGSGTVVAVPAVTNISGNAFTYSLGAHSVYHLVLKTAPTGISNVATATDLRVYPNPAGKLLYVDCSATSNVRVFIYDLTGRSMLDEVMTPAALKGGIAIDALPVGSYLLDVNNKHIIFQKL